jgi:TPP-dependent pyruvate/acetoin dehydrogenase alpha subunit
MMAPQGKDGLALKAARGEAVAADLARQCPLLTPQQLYRLTEHYDNDWAIGAVWNPTSCRGNLDIRGHGHGCGSVEVGVRGGV